MRELAEVIEDVLASRVSRAKAALDVRGAADLLGVSPRWIRDRLRLEPNVKGSLPAYKLPAGGTGERTAWRFDADELMAWLHAGCPCLADWRARQEGR